MLNYLMLASQCGLALLEGDFAVILCSFHIKASPLLSQAVRLTLITKMHWQQHLSRVLSLERSDILRVYLSRPPGERIVNQSINQSNNQSINLFDKTWQNNTCNVTKRAGQQSQWYWYHHW